MKNVSNMPSIANKRMIPRSAFSAKHIKRFGIINALAVALACVFFVGCMTPQQHTAIGNSYYNAGRYDSALYYYQIAASQGDSNAQNNIGNLYYSGEGVPKNYAEAMLWFRKAAAQGYAGAQNNIGAFYNNGYGVPKNYAEAMSWYRKAAAQGHAGAQNNIGTMYHSGEGVPKNYAEAMLWYRTAAAQGDQIAKQNILGLEQLMAEEKRQREDDARRQEEQKRQEEQRISEEATKKEEQRKADELARQNAQQAAPTTDASKPTYIIKSWKFDKVANTANFKIEVTDLNMVYESRGHMMERVYNICRQEYAAAYPGVHSDNIHFSPISEFEDSTMSITVSIYVVRPVRHSYDPATRRGTLTLDIGQKNYQETYRWAIDNIGLICSTKSVVLTQGESIPAGAQFKILKESTNEDGLQEIEFQVVQ